MKRLKTVVGQYHHMRPLRDATVKPERAELEFVDFKAVGASFNDMLKDQRYDVCEMALVAFMQAVERGAPIRMLPVVALGGFVHRSIYYMPSRGPLTPFELADKRIGVRSYSQTTGVWARGVLAEQFGLDLTSPTWVATDDAHVAGFQDPSNVENLGTREAMGSLLLAGTVDAAVLHPTQRPAAEFAPLIADPEKAAADWFDRHRVVPANHVICVAPSVWNDPRLLEDVYSMFVRSYRAAGVPEANDRDPLSYDHPHLIKTVKVASDLALQQQLISAPFNAADAVIAL